MPYPVLLSRMLLRVPIACPVLTDDMLLPGFEVHFGVERAGKTRYSPRRVLCAVRSGVVYGAIPLRVCYALSSTEVGCAAYLPTPSHGDVRY